MVDYSDDGVEDVVLTSILQQAYDMYKVFNGPGNETLDQFNRQTLIEKLEAFFQQYLTNVNLARTDLLDSLNGIQFLPLDKNSYLRVQCFINQTEFAFP